MVDGVDNNQAFFSEARGRTRAVYSISSAAIKEFQVGISNMSAEFGRAAGGTVNAVTKSGTNTFSGEGFYFLRDKAFQAQDPFIPDSDLGCLDERRQQFGAGVGGPIKTDKVFFFGELRPAGPQRSRRSCGRREHDLLQQPARFRRPIARPRPTTTIVRGHEPARSEQQGRPGQDRLGDRTRRTTSRSATTASGGTRRTASTRSAVLFLANSANGSDIVKTDFSVVNLNTIISQSWLNEFRLQIGRDYEAADAERCRAGHYGDRRHQLRHAELPAAAGVPARAALSDSRQRHVLPRRAHASRSAPTSISSRKSCSQSVPGRRRLQLHGPSNISRPTARMGARAGARRCRPTRCPASTTTPTIRRSTERPGGALEFNYWIYTFYVQDNWRLTDRLLDEPRPPVRIPAAAAAWRRRDRRRDLRRQPRRPADDRVQPGQEELGAAARPDLRPRRQARHGGAGGVRDLLRPDQQQRGGQRARRTTASIQSTYSFTPTTAGAPIYPATC